MANVSFANWSGVKNPSAGGVAQASVVDRIDVVRGSNLTHRQTTALVEVITVNKAVGPAIVSEISRMVPAVDLHFEQRYANLKAQALAQTPAEAVLRRVQEILVKGMAHHPV